MISPALISLIRTTIPEGLWFNSCGVAQKTLCYSWSNKKFNYTIDVCSINGMWAFGVGCGCNYKGLGYGIWQGGFIYTSFDECLCEAKRIISKFFEEDNIKITYPDSIKLFNVKER